MQELFSIDGEQKIDPNGTWVQGACRTYEWFCCSKKHSFANPDLADQCCEIPECRILDRRWAEIPIFDIKGNKVRG